MRKAAIGEMAEPMPGGLLIFAGLTGEMKVEDIPLAPGVDLAALKAGDTEPLEVVVEVPAGKSKRGWNYRESALRKIVDAVNTRTLAGYKGHQKPENIAHQFIPPATHWVGALWKDGKAYFRGVVDKAEVDLKRWIKAKRIDQVSIFGLPKLVKSAAGETDVVDYQPLSIDWTPLDRAGMPTRIVALAGEMFDALGQGVLPLEHTPGGEMTVKELLAKLREALQNRQITVTMLAGEMGWNLQNVAGEIDAEAWKKLSGAVITLDQVRQALGATGEMDILAVAKEAKKALDAQATAQHSNLIAEVLKEKVPSEAARPVIGEMLHIAPGATKEQIAGEIDELLKKDHVKSLISGLHTDRPVVTGKNDNRPGAQAGQATRVKRVSL